MASITFDGLYAENVLGSFRVIRGFADLRDLARVSVAYELAETDGGVVGNQREPDEERAADFVRYIQRGRAVFFPEVILSVRSVYQTVMGDGGGVVGIKSEETEGLVIRPTTRKNQSLPTCRIFVNEEALEDFRDRRVIRRIDGNHRLHLADTLEDVGTSVTQYLAPFCTILLGPATPEKIEVTDVEILQRLGGANSKSGETLDQALERLKPEIDALRPDEVEERRAALLETSRDDAGDDFTESMVFHVINTKSEPVASEHALTLVMGQSQDYLPDADLYDTAPELYLAALLRRGIEPSMGGLYGRLGSEPLTALHGAAQALVEAGAVPKENAFEDVKDEYKAVAEAFGGLLANVFPALREGYPVLCAADLFAELAARVWLEEKGESDEQISATVETLRALGRWLGDQDLNERGWQARQLLATYEAVLAAAPTEVFFARWWPDKDVLTEAAKDARARKAVFKEVMEEVEAEIGIPLKRVDLEDSEGETFLIRPLLFEAIEKAAVIVVDLSGHSPNVCVEAGYALKEHGRERMIFVFQETEPEGGHPGHQRPPFNLDGFNNVRIDRATDLKGQFKTDLAAIIRNALALETPPAEDAQG